MNSNRSGKVSSVSGNQHERLLHVDFHTFTKPSSPYPCSIEFSIEFSSLLLRKRTKNNKTFTGARQKREEKKKKLLEISLGDIPGEDVEEKLLAPWRKINFYHAPLLGRPSEGELKIKITVRNFRHTCIYKHDTRHMSMMMVGEHTQKMDEKLYCMQKGLVELMTIQGYCAWLFTMYVMRIIVSFSQVERRKS